MYCSKKRSSGSDFSALLLPLTPPNASHGAVQFMGLLQKALFIHLGVFPF